MNSNIETIQVEPQSVNSTLRKLLWVTPLAMVAATVANLILYLVAGAVLPAVRSWPGAGVGQIIGSTSGYLFFGAVSVAIIARLSSGPQRHFLAIAVVGLLLSLALPIAAGFGYAAPGAPQASVATVVTLALMHVLAFGISVPMFMRLALD